MKAAALGTKRRILLLGDGLWAVAALHHLIARHDVPAVVLRAIPTDHSLERAAHKLGVPCRTLDHVNSRKSVDWIRSLNPDHLLSVSYDQIFRRPLLEPGCPPILNLHAGDPSRHRGRAILCWQLLEGVREIPLCVMRVTRGIDAGPLLARQLIPIGEHDDYGQVLGLLTAQVPALLDEALRSLDAGHCLPESAEAVPRYYPRRRQGDEWIDWTESAQHLQRLIRALALPNCQARTRIDSRVLAVGAAGASVPTDGSAGAPGSVVGIDPVHGLLVRCGEGALWIRDLSWEDGEPAPVAGFRLSMRLGSSTIAELEELRLRVGQLEERLALLEPMLSVDRGCAHEL